MSRRALTGLAILPFFLCGCLAGSIPSQSKPSCSWSSTPPSNAGSLCQRVFRTLADVVRAERRGDNATIRRIAAPPIAGRIIAHGRGLRRQGILDLHVVPSITLETLDSGEIGAGFYLQGKTRAGKVHQPETVYLDVGSRRARILHDQPLQEW